MADAHKHGWLLPVLQICGGCLLLVFGIVAIASSCKWSYFAAPLLTSTMVFVPTGALGMYFSTRANTVWVSRKKWYRVLSRLASLVSVAMFVLYCSAAALEEPSNCTPGLKGSSYACGKLGARLAIDGLIIVSAFLEMVFCLLTSFDLRWSSCTVQGASSTKALSFNDVGESTSMPMEPKELIEGPSEPDERNNVELTNNGNVSDEMIHTGSKENMTESEHFQPQDPNDGSTSSHFQHSLPSHDSDSEKQAGNNEIIADVHSNNHDKIRSHGKLVPQDSFLTDSDEESDEEGPDVGSRLIRPSMGGYIRLPRYGVSLFIPVWALQQDCRITLKILPQPASFLLTEDEAVISPGVICEPSGTRFKTPLKLVLPHCAVLTDPAKAKVTMHFTHGDKKVSKEELHSTGTPRCVVREDILEVYFDHFSICEMFMVISDYFLGKRVASTPYLPKSMSRLQPQYCHLRLFNDTPGLENLIEAEEDKLEYRKMAPTKTFYVLWEKGELKIRCDAESGHVTQRERTVSLEDIYRLERNVINFLIKAIGDAEVYLKFDFHPHCDEGHAFNAKFSGIAQEYRDSFLNEEGQSSCPELRVPSPPFIWFTSPFQDFTFSRKDLCTPILMVGHPDGAITTHLQRPLKSNKIEPEASLSSQETSMSSESKNAANTGSEPPAIPTRLDDKFIFDIADEIETDDQLERLMQSLQVTQASRLRCHEQNRIEGRLTARGTRQMLMNWRAETAVSEQRNRLRDALTQAKLLDLRDRFFYAENKQ